MADSGDGREFEEIGLEIARSIHDPLGLQGSVMYAGKERAGLFIDHTSIQAFEFTVSKHKQKAEKDAGKLVELLKGIGSEREHKFKALLGWFVTESEPTAEQRTAVQAIGKKSGTTIHAVSLRTLQQQVCDVRGYLVARDRAPFGSTAYNNSGSTDDLRVTPEIQFGADVETPTAIAKRLAHGDRILLLGEFGVGKSFTLKLVYEDLRRSARRSDVVNVFPVHINLADCTGLRSGAEVLRRHAEELGYRDSDGLISAWRAGMTVLLLDGFDEVVPQRWMGRASNLRQVRREALGAIRDLVEDAPQGTGVLVCGRSHYFSSTPEMLDALGLVPSSTFVSKMDDFNAEQLNKFLGKANFKGAIPDWLPTRPLLVSYLVASNAVDALPSVATGDRAQAWRQLFQSICNREAKMFKSVQPEDIEQIVSRVATLARSRGTDLGPLEMAQIQQAFYEISGYQPDEEGTSLLLRLPGLAVSTASGEKDKESRVFVDRELAAVAYGLDFASYVMSPYDKRHPLASPAQWTSVAPELAVDVAARQLGDLATKNAILAVADRRQDQRQFDAVLADLISLTDAIEGSGPTNNYMIDGVLYELLTPGYSNDTLGAANLKDCVIETLDITTVTESTEMPTLTNCMVGFLDGAESVPAWLKDHFGDTTIEGFAQASATTAGLLKLDVSDETAVALTILKKIYRQRGSGRKEQSLYRGLDPARRALAPDVVQQLLSAGWLIKSGSGSRVQYHPVKDRRVEAKRILEAPGSFEL